MAYANSGLTNKMEINNQNIFSVIVTITRNPFSGAFRPLCSNCDCQYLSSSDLTLIIYGASESCKQGCFDLFLIDPEVDNS